METIKPTCRRLEEEGLSRVGGSLSRQRGGTKAGGGGAGVSLRTIYCPCLMAFQIVHRMMEGTDERDCELCPGA